MDAAVRPPLRWRFSAFDPLSFVAFPDYPQDLPTRKWLKRIPLFAGRLGESVNDHLDKFLQVVWEFNVEHEDVVMRMFVSTLEREARAWYKPLHDASLMDGIPFRRNSPTDGQIYRTFSCFAHFFKLLKSMKVKLFSNLTPVFPTFTI
jgi:hypothetical protein